MGVNKIKGLSVIGYGLLFQKATIVVYYKKKDYNLYFRLLGKVFSLFLLYEIVPAVIICIITSLLKNDKFMKEILNALCILYVYIFGVIITEKLYKWCKKNDIIEL